MRERQYAAEDIARLTRERDEARELLNELLRCSEKVSRLFYGERQGKYWESFMQFDAAVSAARSLKKAET